MDEVVKQTKGIIERVKGFEEDDSVARVTDIPSPTDGKPLRETLRGYRSQDGEFMVYKVIGGRKMEESEVRELVEKRTIGPLDGFISAKTRNRFAAVIRLVRDEEKQKWKTEFDFGDKFDLATLAPLWTDPATGANCARRVPAMCCASATAKAGNKPSASAASCARRPSRRNRRSNSSLTGRPT